VAAHLPSLIRVLLCAGLGILSASCAGSRDIYVATTGSDDNPGTEDAPFLTIARADAAARPGYTIHVAPGTYRVEAPAAQDAGIKTTHSGTASARIRFVSSVKQGAKIVFSGTGIAWNSKGSYVDIDGFDISGSGRIGILAEGSGLIIRNNFIHDLMISGGCTGNGGAAIDTYGPGGNVLIEANIVRNIGYRWIEGGTCNTVQGIYISNANNTVKNNIVSGVAAAGIQQWHGATSSTIVNNTVFHNKIGILIGQGDGGASARGSENNKVANNIVYDNTKYGIVEQGKVGLNNHYIDNLVYSSGTNVLVAGKVSGTISADPLFVNYQPNGAGDYRLLATSPAIRKSASKSRLAAGLSRLTGEASLALGADVK
jgi:parallel beta-helix repeat protein